ncbi:hypothetical protein D3C73_696210 [compost metagenome]
MDSIGDGAGVAMLQHNIQILQHSTRIQNIPMSVGHQLVKKDGPLITLDQLVIDRCRCFEIRTP